MVARLLEILVCPLCKSKFSVKSSVTSGAHIVEGLLLCRCGMKFPIINSIPRILPGFIERPSVSKTDVFEKKQALTKKSFGYQWMIFKKMSPAFENNFMNYIYPIKKSFFIGKLGLDAGCGFGRHIYYAAQFGAEMVGIDLSEAIDSTYHNTKHLANVHLVQCDIYNLPFRKEVFDFIYSIGVLHHLPDPEAGFKSLLPYLKKKSPVFIWVYSNKRKLTNFLIESLRKMTLRLPLKVILCISFFMAFIEWAILILPYKMMQKLKIPQSVLNKAVFARIRLYAQYPFQVSCADWFDRLSPPIRFYYSGDEIRQWFKNIGADNIFVSETGLYGWRGYGEKQE